MKKWAIVAALVSLCGLCVFGTQISVQAKEEIRVEQGVYADDINLSGMTKEQVLEALESRLENRCDAVITLVGIDGNQVAVPAKDMGLSWGNRELCEEAIKVGKTGNIINRYKIRKDLEHENLVLPIRYDVDLSLLQHLLIEKCEIFNKAAVDAVLQKTEDGFHVVPGETGYMIDEAASIQEIVSYLDEEWDGKDCAINLVITESHPQAKTEDLAQIQDVLGSFSTSYQTSGASRSANVENGCNLINGTILYPGEEFSTYETISPFSTENGYFLAGSYLNGKVVESLGGGICQVSTTLYNAVLLSELEVTERHNHSMIIGYVDPSADAAISESAGKDFRFVNNTDYPIYIEGYTADKHITFNIYGKEIRDPNRKVSYYSEILEKQVPETDVVYTDAAQPAGWYGNKQAAHIGYKAKLWKRIEENGEEVSREQINSSTYNKSPGSVTIGVSTPDPNIYNALMAAAASQNVNVAIATAQAVAGGTPVSEIQVQQTPQPEQVTPEALEGELPQ